MINKKSTAFERSVKIFYWRAYTGLYRLHCTPASSFVQIWVKVRRMANTGKRYNQEPHLTQDTTWESNKNTININDKSQEISSFPAADHKAATNRRESMRNTRHKNTINPKSYVSV